MRLLYASSRSCAVLVDPSGDYNTAPYRLILNGRDVGERDRSVASVFDLLPDTEYVLEARRGDEPIGAVMFRTMKGMVALPASSQALFLRCPDTIS